MASNVAVIEVDDVGVRGPAGSGSINDASGITIDTGEKYRIIMLSDGTVTAVPYDAVPPDTPATPSIVVRLSSVGLSWPAAARATSYIIYRNGSQIGVSNIPSYRDPAITVGNTYAYTVASVDQYKQRSSASAPVDAFVDIALNNAPQDFAITVWPNPVPTDGYSFVNVNVWDIDVQNIAYALNVDAGSLTPTADLGVWKLRI